jgi:hypothetical protein
VCGCRQLIAGSTPARTHTCIQIMSGELTRVVGRGRWDALTCGGRAGTLFVDVCGEGRLARATAVHTSQKKLASRNQSVQAVPPNAFEAPAVKSCSCTPAHKHTHCESAQRGSTSMLWLDAQSSAGEIPAQPEHACQCHRVSIDGLDGSMMGGMVAHLCVSSKVVLCARRAASADQPPLQAARSHEGGNPPKAQI